MVRYIYDPTKVPTSRIPIEWIWLRCPKCPYRFLCRAYGQPLCLKNKSSGGVSKQEVIE